MKTGFDSPALIASTSGSLTPSTASRLQRIFRRHEQYTSGTLVLSKKWGVNYYHIMAKTVWKATDLSVIKVTRREQWSNWSVWATETKNVSQHGPLTSKLHLSQDSFLLVHLWVCWWGSRCRWCPALASDSLWGFDLQQLLFVCSPPADQIWHLFTEL